MQFKNKTWGGKGKIKKLGGRVVGWGLGREVCVFAFFFFFKY